MKALTGGQSVQPGFYWNTRTWEFIPVAGPDGALPGDATTRFFRTPAPMVMVVGPLMGLGYFLFLPIIGPAVLLAALVKKLGGLLQRAITPVVLKAAPSWVPGVSYLARHAAKQNAAKGAPVKDERIDKLAKEIDERRRHGEK